MKTTLLLIALAFSIQAQTIDNKPPFDEWEFLAQGHNVHGVVNVHFAPKTIARNDDVVKVTLRLKNIWGAYFRESWHGSYESMPIIGTVFFDAILDCKKREVSSDDSLVYNPHGYLIAKVKEREKVKETPNSIAWMAFEYFCEKEGKKLTGPPMLKTK